MPPARQHLDTKEFSIYLVALDREVLAVPRFIRENPQHNPIKPCVYVGMTGLSRRERFLNQKRGHKACKLVQTYGVCLKPRLYRRSNPMTRSEAEAVERELARRLRNRGYAV